MAFVLSPIAPAVAQAKTDSGDGHLSPEQYINSDGSLSIPADLNGSLDLAGWNVSIDPARGPVFRPVSAIESETPSDTLVATDTPPPSDTPALPDPATDTPQPSDTLTLEPATSTETPSSTFTQTIVSTSTSTATATQTPSITATRPPRGLPLLPQVAQGEWEALGSNGAGNGSLPTTVNAVAVIGSDVYVGGYFQNVNNNGTVLETADWIAKWDGGSWSALGSNGGGNGALTGVVFSLAVMGTDLYVGGQFGDISNNGSLLLEGDKIAKWDGSNWSALGNNGVGNGALVNGGDVTSMAVIGSDLYVGGGFLNAAGNPVADRIAKWNGSSWSALSSNGAGEGSLNGTVYAIAAIGSDLYVGGAFTNVDNGGTSIPEADKIAKWDGSNWSALSSNGVGDGAITDTVFSLAAIGSDLYVGGDFTNVNNNGTTLTMADFIAKWNGTNWSALGSNGGGDGALNARVTALAAMGSELFVGGAFVDAATNGAADRVARWDGSNWLALGSNGAGGGSVTSDVWGLVVSGDNVYVGGQFGDVNNNGTGLPAADYIAVFRREASTPTPTFTPTETLTPSLTPSNTPTATSTAVPATDGQWSALGGVGSGLAGVVYVIVVDNGVIYAGGGFSNAGGDPNADNIAKFSGGVWSSLNGAGTGLNATVEDIQIDSGVIYAGGWFLNAGGVAEADYIAQFSGGSWSALGAGGFNASVRTVEVDGGVLYAGGEFTNLGGNADADYIAKFESGAWAPLAGGSNVLNAAVLDVKIAAGVVYAGGGFTNAGGDANADRIARFSGGAWSSLGGANSGLSASVWDLAIDGGIVYAGGAFIDAGGATNADYIAQFSGGAWSSLGAATGLNSTVQEIHIAGGVVYAGGFFNNAGGETNADWVAKFNGSTWSAISWNASALDNTVYAIDVDSNVLFAGGAFANAGGDTNADVIAQIGLNVVPTLTPTLSPTATNTPVATNTLYPPTPGAWSPLGGGLNFWAYSLAIESGVVYAGGSFLNAGGDSNADYIARFTGGSWSSLGGAGSALNGEVRAVLVHNGIIYAGGSFTDAGGDPDADRIAKYFNGFWTSLGGSGSGLNASVTDIELDGGILYVSGGFTDAGGDVNADRIAKFSGGTWSALGGSGSGLNGLIWDLAIDTGVIYAGGNFTDAGGDLNADNVAKFTGGVWSSLNGAGTGLGGIGGVYALEIYNGILYAGGDFVNAGGDALADNLAKFTGGSWSSLGPGVALNDYVFAVGVNDDAVHAGGNFSNAGGNPDGDYIARYGGAGWIPVGGSGSGLNWTVRDILIWDETLYAGGDFTNAGGNANADYVAMFGLVDLPTPTPTITNTPSFTPTFTPTLPVTGNPSFPSGSTTDRTPIFTWAQVSGATQYRYQVYKGATLLYTKTVPTPVCVNSRCTDEPATSLTNGEYKWHVQAMVAGVFGAYSPDLGFWIVPPAVSYDFGTSSVGWAAIDAPWSLSGGFFTSLGNSDENNTVYQFDNYETLTLEVRAERESSDPFWALNYVFFRGKPNFADADGDWTDGYAFYWANDQTFYLGYYKSNLFYQLIDWTFSSAISPNANIVKVSATGTTLMLSINGKLLVYGTQPALSSGQVGIGFYRHPSTSGDVLNIDWASLKPVGRGFIDAGAETDGAINIDLIQPVLVEDGGPITSDRPIQDQAAASSTPTLPADPAASSSTAEGLPDVSEIPAKNTPAINMPATQTPRPTLTATIQQLALAEPGQAKRIRNPHGSMDPK